MQMKKKLLSTLLLTVLITSTLAACGQLQTSEKPVAPLRVGFSEWWGDYTLLVAQEEGKFQQYGVQVEPVYYENFSDYVADLAAGQMDVAILGMGDSISVNHISPINVVAISDDGGADAIIARPEINSIQDLKGKKVGVLVSTQYELMVTEMLRSANMGAADVTIVEVDPEDAASALRDNKVQAVYSWEPYLSEAIADGNKRIYPTENIRLFPDVMVFRRSIVEQRPAEVSAFLRAWFWAVEYRLQHEGETRDTTARYLGIDAKDVKPDNNLRILSLNDNKAMFDIQQKNSIYSVANLTANYLISIGAVTQQTDMLELLTPGFLP
jgi:NitT/TauT family transport system substrate-binding protein